MLLLGALHLIMCYAFFITLKKANLHILHDKLGLYKNIGCLSKFLARQAGDVEGILSSLSHTSLGDKGP